MSILVGILCFAGGIFTALGVKGGIAWFKRRGEQANRLVGDARENFDRIRHS